MNTSYTLLRDSEHCEDVEFLRKAQGFATDSQLYRWLVRNLALEVKAARAQASEPEPEPEAFEDQETPTEAPELPEVVQEEEPTPAPYEPDELPPDEDLIELESLETQAELSEGLSNVVDWRPLIARCMVLLARVAPPHEANKIFSRVPKHADRGALVALLLSHCKKYLRERRLLN